MTRIARLRERAKACPSPAKASLRPTCRSSRQPSARPLKTHPTVNSSIDGDQIVYHGAGI